VHSTGAAAALELAPRPSRPRCLTVAAPAHAITIRRAAEIFGEDEELLWDMATDMDIPCRALTASAAEHPSRPRCELTR
jgi:hypothetical protein